MNLNYRFLQALLGPLGIGAIIIGSMIVFMGVLPTLHFFESTLAQVLNQAEILEPQTISPTIDNEFRFYAVYWLSYGLLTLWVAMHIETQYKLAPYILIVFFMGGLARIISVVSIGQPHQLVTVLMYIELLAPVLGFIIYYRLPRGKSNASNS